MDGPHSRRQPGRPPRAYIGHNAGTPDHAHRRPERGLTGKTNTRREESTINPAPLLISGAVLCLPSACGTDQTETNKDIVRRMTEAINERDFDALDGLVAQDLHRHSAATPGVTVENLDQFKEFLRQDLLAVPDAQQEINFMLAEDDLVAAHVTYRGTQTGQWGPFPASSEAVELPFIGILRIEDGKIAEIWVEWDNLNALTQLGHLSPAAGEETASSEAPRGG